MKRQVGSPKSNERTLVAALVSPGTACAESLLVESDPTKRTNAAALVAVGCLNSYVPDGMIRPRVQTKIGIAQLRDARGPAGTWPDRTSELLVAHSALRLTCNHAGYAPIWREQVGEAWREPKPSSTWPVLEGDDARWVVRAAIDAVVADAYGLSRDQYAHVLSTFSHKSYPKAPGLCLAAFDELKKIGIEAFTRRHDPYYDIPLNEDLPKPIIDIPMPSGTPGQLDLGLGGPEDAARPRKRKKG